MNDQPKPIHVIGIFDKDSNPVVAGTVDDPLEAINSPKLKEAADKLKEQEQKKSQNTTK